MLLYIPILILVLLVGLHLHFRYCHAGRLIAKIPGPRGWPLIGILFQVLLPPDELFLYARKLRAECKGPIIQLTSFNIRIVNIYDPVDIEIILSTTRFNEKRLPYTFLAPWLGQGLLVSNGNKWHQRRKLLTSAFHFNILKQFCQTIIEQTEELLGCVQAELVSPRTDLVPIITKATLRIMCETSMGTSLREGAESKKYISALYTIGYCIVNRMIRPWLYPDGIFYLSAFWRMEKSALKYLHKFTNQVILERKVQKASNEKANDGSEVHGQKNKQAFLDLLLVNERDKKIDNNGIREEVDTFMFEGHDTTAMALCFMIMRIANEPIVQNCINEELQCIFGDDSHRPVTFEDLGEMKYLECCIKESLRLYPSVPFIARHITEDVILGGYRVPAGTICQINVFDIHRDEAVYPDPERFIPERFFNGKRHPYAYIPFSAGPRNCIGMKFAMMELKVVMCGLLRRFRLEPVTRPADVRFTGDLVLRAAHPLYVRFVDRGSNDC
ncbi:cytochrome P450 4C1-like [Cydia pomonella]|uniref:cytochrome P450 4C1-like n=1 Tax=Cydia pomonella TaxID=82600 RepID=UPI002ADE765D|nr:cytochrome P450 4C1-like [Cydia pomonella]